MLLKQHLRTHRYAYLPFFNIFQLNFESEQSEKSEKSAIAYLILKKKNAIFSGEKPYQCSICLKTFADRSNMTVSASVNALRFFGFYLFSILSIQLAPSTITFRNKTVPLYNLSKSIHKEASSKGNQRLEKRLHLSKWKF